MYIRTAVDLSPRARLTTMPEVAAKGRGIPPPWVFWTTRPRQTDDRTDVSGHGTRHLHCRLNFHILFEKVTYCRKYTFLHVSLSTQFCGGGGNESGAPRKSFTVWVGGERVVREPCHHCLPFISPPLAVFGRLPGFQLVRVALLVAPGSSRGQLREAVHGRGPLG